MIPVFRPSVNVERALEILRETLESGWLGQGPRVLEFEEAMRERLGVKHFIATSSGTAALHLAVKALNLKPGSEVLTSPITFLSGNAVLLYEGLVPRMGRVWPSAGNLRGDLRRTDLETVRAVIVTHLGGFAADMHRIDERTEIYGRPVIEDCAHALGARYPSGRMVGDTDNVCCWSFHAVKNLGIGDGGGISTNDDDQAERFRRLRWLGIDKSTHARSLHSYSTDYEVPELGYKYHMNDVAASIAIANLETLDDDNRKRHSIAMAYINGLKGCELPDYRYAVHNSSCHFLPVFVADPASVGEQLARRGIATTRHYKPNHRFKCFQGKCLIDADAIEAADEYYERALILPLFPSMTQEEIATVIDNFNEVTS